MMNDAQLHLALNHLPLVFPFAGIVVMLVGILSKSQAVQRTAYLLFILAALFTIAAMWSGEEAEHMVEHLPGVEHDYIENHEHQAETLAILLYILGGLSLLGLLLNLKQRAFQQVIAIGVTIFAVILLFFGKQTATSGGEIRHPEIRPGFEVSASEHH